MSGRAVYQGVTMSTRAADVAAYAGADVLDDVERLRSGDMTESQLLAYCLDGAEEQSTMDAWREYVAAIVIEAEAQS